MIKRIFKYELALQEGQNISLPLGAEILTIQAQNKIPCLWALVDPNKGTEIRHFEIFATGDPVLCDIGVDRKYISTFQLEGGLLVFHAFEYTGV